MDLLSVNEDVQCGHIPNSIRYHGFHVIVANVGAMFDGIHPRLYRVVSTFQAHGVGRHFVPLAVCLVHDGVKLLCGKRGNTVYDTAGRRNSLLCVNLDPVSAVGNLFAHGFAALHGSVDHLHAVR